MLAQAIKQPSPSSNSQRPPFSFYASPLDPVPINKRACMRHHTSTCQSYRSHHRNAIAN